MVVSLSSTYFDDPRSNPAEGYNFSVLIFVEKGGNKQKEAWIGHFLGNHLLAFVSPSTSLLSPTSETP